MKRMFALLLCLFTLPLLDINPSVSRADNPAPASRPAIHGPREFPVPDGINVQRDIEYAKVGDISLKLNVYIPADARGALPTVVWIHGGGWFGGDKDNKGECWVLPMVKHGYVIANINYRLTGQAIFPAQIYDCKAAIRFLRAHAVEYHIDTNRIGASGGSAGGHLVALLGVSGDVKELEGNVGNCLDQTSRVQAVVDLAGPSDFPLFIKTIKSQAIYAKNAQGAVKGLLGSLDENAAIAIKASPVTYASKDSAPTLIIHGGHDLVVPPNQAHSLFDALESKGADVTLHIVGKSGHIFGLAGDDTLALTYAFFDMHFRPQAAQ